MTREERERFVRAAVESEWLLSQRRKDREEVIMEIVERWEADLRECTGEAPSLHTEPGAIKFL